MLKSYPEQVLNFAVGGVIAPSALGQAARADQLVAVARQRAAEVLQAVPAQVDAALAQARSEGFQQGYAEAVELAVPLLAATLADVQAQRATLLGQLRAVIQDSLAAEGVEAALIIARCERALAEGESRMMLHVPAQSPTLADAVKARLTECASTPPLQLARGEGPLPLLRLGTMVFELDPAGAMHRAVEASVDADALETAARTRADAYVAEVNARMKRIPFPDTTTGEVQ
jgi:hypothetical protein